MPPILIDTNVLLYAIDHNEPFKQGLAVQLLDTLVAAGIGVLSVQNLAEFTSASLRNLKAPLTAAAAMEQAAHLAEAFSILDLTVPIVLEAARGVRDYQMSYYDAQLWATARLNQIPVIFSEDFASNTSRDNVHFVNPFAPSFDLQAWT
jgi:predicted nucleic acid-binding protein